MEQIKRNRSINWTEQEKKVLKTLVLERANILEKKDTSTNTNTAKKLAWAEVLSRFNAINSAKRDIYQLQNQWRNMKNKAKKSDFAYRAARSMTGGGPPPPSPPPEDIEIMEGIPNEFYIDSNCFDSDSNYLNQNREKKVPSSIPPSGLGKLASFAKQEEGVQFSAPPIDFVGKPVPSLKQGLWVQTSLPPIIVGGKPVSSAKRMKWVHTSSPTSVDEGKLSTSSVPKPSPEQQNIRQDRKNKYNSSPTSVDEGKLSASSMPKPSPEQQNIRQDRKNKYNSSPTSVDEGKLSASSMAKPSPGQNIRRNRKNKYNSCCAQNHEHEIFLLQKKHREEIIQQTKMTHERRMTIMSLEEEYWRKKINDFDSA